MHPRVCERFLKYAVTLVRPSSTLSMNKSMSYHRVLPLPTPVFHHGLSVLRDQEPLLGHMMMESQASKPSAVKVNNLSPNDSLPTMPVEISDQQQFEELQENDDRSPRFRARSAARTTLTLFDRTQYEGRSSPSRNPKSGAVAWHSEICLCQPDPKIPRPRNAFILYRQHHQSMVVKQNPGLSNPGISKIIGDHWKSSPPEIKTHWKNLAEQEKLRHQKQHPDYRYQPRRGGKSMIVSVADGETRCPKCGGRSIAKSTSMLSEPNFSPQNCIRPSGHPAEILSINSTANHFIHHGEAPVSATLPSATAHIPPSMGDPSAFSPKIKRQNHTESPLSPDSKRRCANNTYQLNSLQLPTRRPQSLPRPEFMPPQNAGSPTGPLSRSQPPPSSLTLAPLQSLSTILSSGPSTPPKPLEAMILSIPTPNKIRVLSQISPPLTQPKPPSHAYRVRGYVVAIDGPVPETVTQVTDAVFSALTVHHPVRIFHGPAPVQCKELPSKNGDDFQSYLDTISQYHTLSAEITSYITTPASSSYSKSVSPISPKTIPPTGTQTRSLTFQQAWQKQSPPPSPQKVPIRGAPIALLPSYQLSHTDASASSIPITDAYAPVDHWQWMATLWRGIVGPDVTIAIAAPGSPVFSSNGKATKNIGGSVEIRLEDLRTILLSTDHETGTVVEGALRRVCFELGEWVRAGAY